MVNVPPATRAVLRCAGNADPGARLERNPHCKHNALLTQGQEVHAQTKVKPGCDQTANTTRTHKPEIQVQTREYLQDSSANSVSPAALPALSLRLQLSH